MLAGYMIVQPRTMELTAALPPSLFHTTGFLPACSTEYGLEGYTAHSFDVHKREPAAQIRVFRDGIGR